MEVRELLSVLDQLRKLYVAGEAKAAKDLATLIGCLTPFESDTLDSLLVKLDAATVGPTKKQGAASNRVRSTSSPKASLSKVLDEASTLELVNQLTGAGTDEEKFSRAFALVSADPRVKVKDADTIARRFTRQHGPFKTKKAAFDAIRQAFLERARFENKLRAVG